ncbi:MAG: NYN domain-containing protein [Planctomycetales bacterium]|nr:NYN domain-containing protein [Planctomycetales bacterium]
MALIIDGYNLLHITGIFGKGAGPGGFQRSREALLRFLAASIRQPERRLTTIVFDAADAPPGLPQSVIHEEMSVRYAVDYPDADSLIEELIQQHDVPRNLLVVSSDHRIQRAARRRRAKFIDSDLWYTNLWQQRIQLRVQLKRRIPEKPVGDLTAEEIDYWVNEFTANDPLDESGKELAEEHLPWRPQTEDIDNPFPPGYGEDLLG